MSEPNAPLLVPDLEEMGVLIVGAGPTGMTLAIELARRNAPFSLIDRLPARAKTSRAIGTQPRTIEVFALMGIPLASLAPAVHLRGFVVADEKQVLAHLNLGAGEDVPTLISMDESDTERVLERRLAALGGSVTWDHEFLGYRQTAHGIVATIRQAGVTREVAARYLVGADGAHSAVRQAAGIGFRGSAYPERFLLADLDLDWAEAHNEGHIWLGEDGLAAAVPLPGEKRFRLIIPLPRTEEHVEFTSEEQMAERAVALLRERSGANFRVAGPPAWASAFRISRRQADRYRNGPVFIAGDAAHVHSPVGGQGMNLGIQDAFNLGWKLALAIHAQAAPGLLDTYQAERFPVARSVLRGTHLATELVLSPNPLLRALRSVVVPQVVNFAPIRERFMPILGQLHVNYGESFLSRNAAPARHPGPANVLRHAGLRAGDRVPDDTLRAPDTGAPVSLYTLLSNGWLLLLFPGASATPETLTALADIAEVSRYAVGNAVQPFLIAPKGQTLPLPPSLPSLLDPTGELTRRFSTPEGLVALVRPDGYLGFRGFPDQPGELASYLARVFAMRLPAPEPVATL